MNNTFDEVAYWYLVALTTHPLLFIAAQSFVVLAAWCGLGTLLYHHEQRRDRRAGIRHLENYANQYWKENRP